MPYKVHEALMITSSDGKGVILSGGYNNTKIPLDTILELRENELNQELEWIVWNQTMSTPRRGHVMFLVSDKFCENTTMENPITIHHYCENSLFAENAMLKWSIVGTVIILLSILVPIKCYYNIRYFYDDNEGQMLGENEIELTLIQNLNMMTEKNPSYENADINPYPQEVFSLPHIDIKQIQKGKIIGTNKYYCIIVIYFHFILSPFLNISIHFRIWKFW